MGKIVFNKLLKTELKTYFTFCMPFLAQKKKGDAKPAYSIFDAQILFLAPCLIEIRTAFVLPPITCPEYF